MTPSSHRSLVMAAVLGATLVGAGGAASAASSPKAGATATASPRCTGTTWRYAGGRRTVQGGQVLTTIRLKNTSGRACAVRGYATVSLYDARGAVLLPLSEDRMATHRVEVPRAGTVHLVLRTSAATTTACGAASRTAVIGPPDTRQVLRITLAGLHVCRGGGSVQPVTAGA